MSRLVAVEIDDAGLPPPSPAFEQERRVAIWDLIEENSFALPARADGRRPHAGPYRLKLCLKERRLVFDLTDEAGERVAEFHLSMGPFRQVVKDYLQICESYFAAVRHWNPAQVEAIDMARRGIHNEGARVLIDRLLGKAEVDHGTARRLFTLICILAPGA